MNMQNRLENCSRFPCPLDSADVCHLFPFVPRSDVRHACDSEFQNGKEIGCLNDSV